MTYTPIRPTVLSQPPINPSMTGSFTPKAMFGVDVAWTGPDADEVFTAAIQETKARKYTMLEASSGPRSNCRESG